MTDRVRLLFMSAETQSHVSHVIWQVAKTCFVLAYKNGTLPKEVFDEVRDELNDAEGKDITEVARFFRKRCRFFKNNFDEGVGTIVFVMRFVVKNDTQLLQKSSGLTHKNVQILYDRLRELDPLIQNLKYYRNFFSHNFANIENFGWSSAVLTSVIRLCEIALVEKQDYTKNQNIMLAFRKELSSLYQNKPPLLETEDVSKKSDERLGHDLQYIFNEIITSKGKILERIDALATSVTMLSEKSEKQVIIKAENVISTPDTNEVIEEIDDDTSDTEFSEESNLSPEILRQELSLISDRIKEEFGKKPGFGAGTNLLQIANIGAILEHEPQNFREFLSLEIVRSRIDFELPVIKIQIEKYEEQIDVMLSSVLWLSAFEG